MKKLLTIIILILTLCSNAMASDCTVAGGADCTKSGTTYTCTSAIYECVQAAVTAATAGDTINITDTTGRTWASQLVIDKSLNLIGPGKNNLTITMGFDAASNVPISSDVNSLIAFSDSSTANSTLKIEGFTFDLASKGWALKFSCDHAANDVDTLIYLNNTIINTALTNNRVIVLYGECKGVAAGNTITSRGHGVFTFYGSNDDAWHETTHTYGTGDYFYVENNTVAFGSDVDQSIFSDSGLGARYVIRYNTISMEKHGDPVWDMHGNQLVGNNAAMGAEIYGNDMTWTQITGSQRAFDQRGGELLAYFNKFTSPTGRPNYFDIREEEDDTNKTYPTGPAPTSQPQHVSNSYSWSNYQYNPTSSLIEATSADIKYGGTLESATDNTCTDNNETNESCNGGWEKCGIHITAGTGAPQYQALASAAVGTPLVLTLSGTWSTNPSSDSTYIIERDCCDAIAENSQWWTQRTGTFDGTGATANGGGVGCGTATTMNAITTCTDGVGFFVPTNITTMPCDGSGSNYGANPSVPITGTLYKCSSNTWVSYYTPYQYPHPLRGNRMSLGSGASMSIGAAGGAVMTLQ